VGENCLGPRICDVDVSISGDRSKFRWQDNIMNPKLISKLILILTLSLRYANRLYPSHIPLNIQYPAASKLSQVKLTNSTLDVGIQIPKRSKRNPHSLSRKMSHPEINTGASRS